MKRVLTIILFSAIAFGVSAQSFERGNMVFSMGTGTGSYKTKLSYKTTAFNWQYKDTSAAVTFPLSFEYRVPNPLKPGIRITYTNYTEQKNAVKTNRNGSIIDIMGGVNPSFFNSKHIDMFLSAEFGYSQIKRKEYSWNASLAVMSGFAYSFGLNTRFYFGKGERLALHLRYTFEGYNYYTGETSDDKPVGSYIYRFKRNGTIFGMALQYKI